MFEADVDYRTEKFHDFVSKLDRRRTDIASCTSQSFSSSNSSSSTQLLSLYKALTAGRIDFIANPKRQSSDHIRLRRRADQGLFRSIYISSTCPSAAALLEASPRLSYDSHAFSSAFILEVWCWSPKLYFICHPAFIHSSSCSTNCLQNLILYISGRTVAAGAGSGPPLFQP